MEAFGTPGKHADSQVRAIASRAVAVISTATVFLVGGILLGVSGLPLAVLALAAIAVTLAAERHYAPSAERWRQGAEGEREVGSVLAGLEADGWLTLHGISLGRGDVDHVVIGPGGVFTIETKSQRGKIGVDRIDPHMLSQAYAEKKLIETIIGLEVQALLVFSRAWLVGSVPAQRRGVTIVPIRLLQHYFSRRRPTMTAERAAEVHAHLAGALSSATRSSAGS